MISPPRTLTKDVFKFQVNGTLCGTMAYAFYCNDELIYKNNNYYPTLKAMEDDELMFKELSKIILMEKLRPFVSEVEKKFLESEDYIKLHKMINA